MAHALEPIRIGTVQLKNRIVFPSMCVFFCDAEGYINDVMTEYVRERARGGVGLLIIPGSPHGKVGPGPPSPLPQRLYPRMETSGRRRARAWRKALLPAPPGEIPGRKGIYH